MTPISPRELQRIYPRVETNCHVGTVKVRPPQAAVVTTIDLTSNEYPMSRVLWRRALLEREPGSAATPADTPSF